MSKSKKKWCVIGIVAVTLVLLMPFLYSLILSMKDFKYAKGLFGSDDVGFKNFLSVIFQDDDIINPYFARTVPNTLIISIIGLFAGAFYTFFSSVAIGSGKQPMVKGVLAALFAIPAILPMSLVLEFIPNEVLIDPKSNIKIFLGIIDGLKMAGLVSVAAFFMKGNVWKESAKCLLLFIAIRLITFFTVDASNVMYVYNDFTIGNLDVIGSYEYRMAILNGSYSYGAAVYIVKCALQFIPAVIGCVILALICKKKKQGDIPTRDVTCMPLIVMVIIPLIIFGLVFVKNASLLPEGINTDMVSKGYINEFIIAFGSAVIVAAVAWGIMMLARNSGVLGIICVALLCFVGKSLIGDFLLVRQIGVYGKMLGAVLSNVYMVAPLSLILTYATNRNRSKSNDIAAVVIGFVIMFAWYWGDWYGPVITLREINNFPFSLILREILISSGMFMGRELEYAPLSTALYILIPFVTVIVGLAIAGIIKAKTNRQSKLNNNINVYGAPNYNTNHIQNNMSDNVLGNTDTTLQ